MNRLNEIFIQTGKTFLFRFTDASTGLAIDITNYKLIFVLKSGSTTLIYKEIDPNDPTNGIGSIELTETDTNLAEGNYLYQFAYKNASGTTFIIDTETDKVPLKRRLF